MTDWQVTDEPTDVGAVRAGGGGDGVRHVTADLMVTAVIATAIDAAGADVALAERLRAAPALKDVPVFDSADVGTDAPEAKIGAVTTALGPMSLRGLTGGGYDARVRVRVSAIVRAERDGILEGRALLGAALEALR